MHTCDKAICRTYIQIRTSSHIIVRMSTTTQTSTQHVYTKWYRKDCLGLHLISCIIHTHTYISPTYMHLTTPTSTPEQMMCFKPSGVLMTTLPIRSVLLIKKPKGNQTKKKNTPLHLIKRSRHAYLRKDTHALTTKIRL
jgi:hypothetical protein